MTTPVWRPGNLYSPVSFVRPTSVGAAGPHAPTNPSFESDLTGWDQAFEFGAGTFSADAAVKFAGTKSALFKADSAGTGPKNSVYGTLINTYQAPVQPGQVIKFSCRVRRHTSPASDSWENGGCRIYWYNASDTLINHKVRLVRSAPTPALPTASLSEVPKSNEATR